MRFKEDYAKFVNNHSKNKVPLLPGEKAILCIFVNFLENQYYNLPLVRDRDIPPTPPVKPPKGEGPCPSNHSLLKLSGHATCPDCKITLPRIGEMICQK